MAPCLAHRVQEGRPGTLAEITDIASQLVRVEIAREQQRDSTARQINRAREEAVGEDREATAGAIRERDDARRTDEVRARHEDDVRDAELADNVQRNIDLSTDAVFDPDLPRGSIIDIVI
mgnify:FL=1